MASVASGLSARLAPPGTTTSTVRHTPWISAFGSAADGAAVLPATIDTITAAPAIRMLECVVMGTSGPQCRAPCTEAQAQRRADAAMARNGAPPVRYPLRRRDPAS